MAIIKSDYFSSAKDYEINIITAYATAEFISISTCAGEKVGLQHKKF
jgi:hypothetical protein